MKKFIVIELQNPIFPTIVTDSEGFPNIYDNRADAEREAETCQNGMVVKIG
jgi:hypothetical protein